MTFSSIELCKGDPLKDKEKSRGVTYLTDFRLTGMAIGNSSSTMEIGASEQELLHAAKRKKKITYVVGGVIMVVLIAAVITAVVLLSGNEGGNADSLIDPTEGTTTVSTTPTIGTETTTAPTVPEATTTETAPQDIPDLDPIELEDVNAGAFSALGFNGTWAGGNEILFQSESGLVLFNVDTETETILIPNTSEVLQQATRFRELSPDRTHIVLSYNVQPVYRHSFLARYSAISVSTGATIDIGPPGVTEPVLQNFLWGPTGTACAFVYLNNVWYKSSLEANAVQITDSGVVTVVYHGIPDWVYEEEIFSSMSTTWFSPDGSYLGFASFNDTNVRIMKIPYYGVPGSTLYQYTLHQDIRYPKSGSLNPDVEMTLVNLATNVRTVIQPPTSLEQPILYYVHWVSGNTVAVMWTNRRQNDSVIWLCTAGQDQPCTEIFSYSQADGWLDKEPLIFNSAGNSFITILPQLVGTARWKQIVQVSMVAGQTSWSLQQRSNTPHAVSSILHWGEDGTIWYIATAAGDPGQQHLYSLSTAGASSCFTCSIENAQGRTCLYNAVTFSPDATKLTINCAGPGVPQTFVYDINGQRVQVWQDNSELVERLSNITLPEVIRMSIQLDGPDPAEVKLIVPPNVQQMTNVPLLVYVYAGPGTNLVQETFSIDWGTSLVSRYGIAVAQIDGRGSGCSSVDNLYRINRGIGSVEIEDQIAVTRYLHQSLPWVDSNRTCIWGWSYGGFSSALSLVRGGDTFRCAISVAPVTDWKYYDSIYTERFMDTPQNNVEGYAGASLLNSATVTALRDKRFFLVHGTADDNVHYQQSMMLSRLLQVNDVFFHQMSYTDENHSLGSVRAHLYHGLEKFLQENML